MNLRAEDLQGTLFVDTGLRKALWSRGESSDVKLRCDESSDEDCRFADRSAVSMLNQWRCARAPDVPSLDARSLSGGRSGCFHVRPAEDRSSRRQDEEDVHHGSEMACMKV